MPYPHHDFVRDGEWRCGCGAINPPDDTHCWQCEENHDDDDDDTTS